MVAKHIAGVHNTVVDALSRNQLSAFFSLHPSAKAAKEPMPCSRVAGGNAHSAVPRLDLGCLEESVSFFLDHVLASSTRQSYKSGQNRYLRFCQDAALSPWLLSEQLLSFFVAQLGKEGLRHQSIICYLSVVRFLSIIRSEGDPFTPGAMPILQYVLRGVSACQPLHRAPVSRWHQQSSTCWKHSGPAGHQTATL